MKYLITILFLSVALSVFACGKKKLTKVEVVKDCTGSYLRTAGKDYLVCNESKLANFQSGATVNASYKSVTNCKEHENKIVCMMFHEHAGIIEITAIK